MIVSLSAAVLLAIGAVRFITRGNTLGTVIYSIASGLFLLAAYAYHKGLLK